MIAVDDVLKTSLLDLHHELRDTNIPLILGGGYGLYLKQIHLQESEGQRTLLDGELWPAPRATQDLDIHLKIEIIINHAAMKRIRNAIDRLGYLPGEARYMQFVKRDAGGREAKIDLLTGPIPREYRSQVKVSKPRVRPKPPSHEREAPVELHAYVTEEAIDIEENLLPLMVSGVLTSGQAYEGTVYIPQPFTYLMMKLFAFRDWKDDPD